MAEITGGMLIGDVVMNYPQAIPVLMKYGLTCIGCRLSPYETLEQGALSHGLDEQAIRKMIAEANAEVGKAKAGGAPPKARRKK